MLLASEIGGFVGMVLGAVLIILITSIPIAIIAKIFRINIIKILKLSTAIIAFIFSFGPIVIYFSEARNNTMQYYILQSISIIFASLILLYTYKKIEDDDKNI